VRLSRRARSLAGLSAVLLCSLAGLTAPALGAGADVNPPLGELPPLAGRAQCAPIIVYATRGSSENNDVPADHATGQSKYYEGLGEELVPIYVKFRELYAPGQVELITNRAPRKWSGLGTGLDPSGPAVGGYPSVGIAWTTKVDPFTLYERSVENGVQAMVSDLNTLRERCPESKLVLLGYSEGAEISRRALARLAWTPAAGQGFVMTFGDVLWRAAEAGVKYVGDAARDEKGVIRAAREGDNGIASPVRFAIPPIPAWAKGWDITTYCHGGDFACQWRGGTLIAHGTYHREDAVGASARLAHNVGGPFAAPVVTAMPTIQGACYPRNSRLTELLTVEGPTPPEFTATLTSQWEPTSFGPFPALAVTAAKPLRRTFLVGWMSRVVVRYGGQKLDYRNRC
jgi:hypothetical protein